MASPSSARALSLAFICIASVAAQDPGIEPLMNEVKLLKEKLATQEAMLAKLAAKEKALPDDYPFLLMVIGAGFFVTNFVLGGSVMNARQTYNVQYPNLYATPGFHKEADAFNRIQRGHQNMFESIASVIVMLLIGGLAYPRVASALGICYCVGNWGYLKGYSNLNKDVKGVS